MHSAAEENRGSSVKMILLSDEEKEDTVGDTIVLLICLLSDALEGTAKDDFRLWTNRKEREMIVLLSCTF
jgi:hypothetical protein